MLSLYNKRDTFLVIGGLLLYHLLVCGLCIFWIYRFLIYEYNPGVYVLLVLFTGITILCDILLGHFQIFIRFITRCKIDSEGIQCFLFGKKTWKICWDKIVIFGIMGFGASASSPVIFLSMDAKEIYSPEKCISITSDRVVFEARENWDKIKKYMPTDIAKKLQQSIDSKRDCFYKR